MKYLVVSNSRTPFPPEMAAGLFGATKAWNARYTASGKMEQAWSFAGLNGGGGILNVDSPEELDEIMAEFPLGPFTDIAIYGLVDLARSLDNGARAVAAMMAER